LRKIDGMHVASRDRIDLRELRLQGTSGGLKPPRRLGREEGTGTWNFSPFYGNGYERDLLCSRVFGVGDPRV
jgi:hypothetical protein